MQYRINQKNKDELSALGLGCMRYPQKGGRVDAEAAVAMIRKAVDLGVNYFDSAYVYHGGKSESILGEALADGSRKKVKIATKLPPYFVRRKSDIEKLFTTQLNRLQTDYIDYYMVHAMSDIGIWQKLKDYGIVTWIAEKKKSGAVKNMGFSFHGNYDQLIKIIDDYDWDFVMIQYNYLDTHNQAGTAGLKYAYDKGLAVIVMEPLRGGSLVNGLSCDVEDLLKDNNINPVELGLSWLFNQKEITVVLSGMSNTQQLTENAKYASQIKANSLNKEALALVQKTKLMMMKKVIVPCTGCRYCVPCPHGVDIPSCFSLLNQKEVKDAKPRLMTYLQATGSFSNQSGNAGRCTQCGICVPLCPQRIDIPAELIVVKKTFETAAFVLISSIAKLVMGGKK